jgi:hypothetical protein
MPTESLFGVLAPLLHRDTIEQVRSRFVEIMTGPAGVNLFINANFGNLVHEFYEPTDSVPGAIVDAGNVNDRSLSTSISVGGPSREFIEWVTTNLGIPITSTNQYAVERIYKSYKRFMAFLNDPKQPKELRHFSSILAEPGLMKDNNRGLQLIVLEWAMDNDATSPRIRCSPYGFSLARHKQNDFAFVWLLGRGLVLRLQRWGH